MTKNRKPEWIRPSVAADIIGITRSAVVYRAGQGRYRTRREAATDTLLVNRRDVEADVAKTTAMKAKAAAAANPPLKATG